MPEFNLLNEDWIQCIDSSGQPAEMSIQRIFTEAQNIKELAHSIPIVNASVLFLLETILIRALTNAGMALDDSDEWIAGFQAGSFDPQALTAYFTKWHDHFYLFDEKHPFMQAIIEGEKYKGTAMKLLPHYSGGTGGNSATLFDQHTEQDGIHLSYPEAANYLLAAHQYGAGGRIIGGDYFSESSFANGLSFFIEGENLFETLFLNLLPYPAEDIGIKTKPDDCPIWERDKPYDVCGRNSPDKGKTYQPLGLLDLLTWPGRKVQLIAEDGQQVCEIKMRSGLKMNDQQFPWYAYNAKGFYLRARAAHAVWRDYAVLLQFRNTVSGKDNKGRSPKTVQWLQEISADEFSFDHPFRITGLGMAKEAGKQKVYFYSAQRLPLPDDYLSNSNLISTIATMLDLAESVQGSLYGAMMAFAEIMLSFDADQKNGRKADSSDKKNLVEHLGAERVYWGGLERAFSIFVLNLPHDQEKTIEQWKASIQAEARKAFNQGTGLAGDSIQALKAITAARGILEAGLNKHLRKGNKEKEGN